ncbi:SGNH/GDSL hydrolase family protein [Lentisalinibacter sediminis]|uniref:SGNH/GDSL hydrolase family protein n=1 Tax=Lentisalinibacter sediminis TaxID=2992237 RepID=UPI0038698D2F
MRRGSLRYHLLHFWAGLPPLAPIAIGQGLWTRRNAVRLPPVLEDTAAGVQPGTAAGNVTGILSEDETPLRLLVVGESTAVGVGATRPEAALAPRLAEVLHREQDRPVSWQVVGENGIRAGGLAQKLRRHRDLLAADVAVVLLGANDTSGLSSVGRWRRDLASVLSLLGERCERIFVAPVPPFHLFRLLPYPLRWLLGHRGLALCDARRALARPGRVIVMEGEFPRERRYLATDGYHPSDVAYATWANQIAEVIKNNPLNSIVEVPPQP